MKNKIQFLMIKLIFIEHKYRYGSLRICHELKARGISCTRAKVAECMAAMGLVALARRKFKVTTDSNHTKPIILVTSVILHRIFYSKNLALFL